MGLRQVAGGNPQERVSRLMAGDSDPMRTFSLPLQAQGDPTGLDDGFEGLGEGSQDYFGISRQPRPQASTQPPSYSTPQGQLELARRRSDGSLTHEQEVELLNRLRMAQQ